MIVFVYFHSNMTRCFFFMPMTAKDFRIRKMTISQFILITEFYLFKGFEKVSGVEDTVLNDDEAMFYRAIAISAS